MFCEDFFFRDKDVLDAQSVSVRRYSYRATNEEAVEFDQGVSFNGPVQIDTYLIDTVCKKGVLYGVMSHSYASPPCRMHEYVGPSSIDIGARSFNRYNNCIL